LAQARISSEVLVNTNRAQLSFRPSTKVRMESVTSWTDQKLAWRMAQPVMIEKRPSTGVIHDDVQMPTRVGLGDHLQEGDS
jgi:hypothetical protein